MMTDFINSQAFCIIPYLPIYNPLFRCIAGLKKKIGLSELSSPIATA